MKILIIEDEPSLRELMSKELAKENHVVETAATFAEASEKVARRQWLKTFGGT